MEKRRIPKLKIELPKIKQKKSVQFYADAELVNAVRKIAREYEYSMTSVMTELMKQLVNIAKCGIRTVDTFPVIDQMRAQIEMLKQENAELKSKRPQSEDHRRKPKGH